MKELQASREADASRSQTRCPRAAHEAGLNADRHAKDAGKLREMASETSDLILQINTTAIFLRVSKNTSALRTIALRALEKAEDALRREIGDPAPRN